MHTPTLSVSAWHIVTQIRPRGHFLYTPCIRCAMWFFFLCTKINHIELQNHESVWRWLTWAAESPPERSAVWPLWFWRYGEKYAEPASICRTPSAPRPPAAPSATTNHKHQASSSSSAGLFIRQHIRRLTSDPGDRRSTFIKTAETPALLLIFSAQIQHKFNLHRSNLIFTSKQGGEIADLWASGNSLSRRFFSFLVF